MPIYEYQCPSCGHAFDHMQKVSDPSPGCPACGGAVQKRVSQTSFQLKGGGWYVTDYSKAGATAPKPVADAASDAKPAADAKPADAKPADAKPAADPKPAPASDSKPTTSA